MLVSSIIMSQLRYLIVFTRRLYIGINSNRKRKKKRKRKDITSNGVCPIKNKSIHLSSEEEEE